MPEAVGHRASDAWHAPHVAEVKRARRPVPLLQRIAVAALFGLVAVFVGRNLLGSIRSIDWAHLHIDRRMATLAVICLMAARLPFALACREILRSLGTPIDARWLTGALCVSALGRYVPGKVAAGAGATVLMARRGVPVPVAVAGLLILNAAMLVIGVLLSMPLAFTESVRAQLPGIRPTCVLAAIIGVVALNPRTFATLCNLAFPRKPLPSKPRTGPYGIALIHLICRAALIGAGGWFTARAVSPIVARDYPLVLAATLFGQIVGFLAFFVPAGLGVQEEALLLALHPLLGAAAGVHALLFRAMQVVADAVGGGIGLLLMHPKVSGQLQAITPKPADTARVDAELFVAPEFLQQLPCKPNFFIVGAAKSGTTSLHDYLSEHPQIFMPAHKEPLYFARDFNVPAEWCVRDDRRYAQLFAKAGPGVTRTGEASVWYLYSQAAAREIKAFSPDAKIIVMLRDPVDMMYSLHGQFLWNCNDDILDFEGALGAQEDRRRGQRIPPEAHIAEALQYAAVATFSPQLKRFFDAFGRDNVHVILFNDFTKDAGGEYRKVLEFLGVDADFAPRFEVVNAAKPITPGFNRFFARRPWLRSVTRAVIPTPLVRRINRWLPYFVRTVRRPNRMPADLRARLVADFLPEIERLERALGRDLSAWKR